MRALFLCVVLLPACSTDTFVTPDGGSGDGGADAACVPTFCSAQTGAAFCSDFDEGSFGADWSRAAASQAPLITLGGESDVTRSCPSALGVGIEKDLTFSLAAPTFSFVEQDLAGGNLVQIDLDALLPNISSGPIGTNLDGLTFFALRAAADPTYYVSLEHSGDGTWYLRAHEGSVTAVSSAPLPNLLLGAWNHLKLTVALSSDPSTGFASLEYDTGNGSLTQTTPPAQTLPNGNVGVLFDLGASRLSQTTQHYDAYFDDVVVTISK